MEELACDVTRAVGVVVVVRVVVVVVVLVRDLAPADSSAPNPESTSKTTSAAQTIVLIDLSFPHSDARAIAKPLVAYRKRESFRSPGQRLL
jgi:hypothetical protein